MLALPTLDKCERPRFAQGMRRLWVIANQWLLHKVSALTSLFANQRSVNGKSTGKMDGSLPAVEGHLNQFDIWCTVMHVVWYCKSFVILLMA